MYLNVNLLIMNNNTWHSEVLKKASIFIISLQETHCQDQILPILWIIDTVNAEMKHDIQ